MTIAKLREELKRISPWPWQHNHDGISDAADDIDVLAENTKINYAFIARAPERIAKLLDVAEAAQFSIIKMMPFPDSEFVMVPKYEFFKLRSMLAALEADDAP